MGCPSGRTLGLLVVAFIFPPVSVLISRNQLDTYFWLNLLLTLLAWLPGAVHAMWVVLCRNEFEGQGEGDLYEPLTRPSGKVFRV